MSKELVFAERQLRYWENRVRRLRQTSDASDAKETEAEIRELPPTPPLKNKGEEKETASTASFAIACTCVRAHARPEERSRPLEEELYDTHTPPSFETAVYFGKQHHIPKKLVREWYTHQNEVAFWLDDITGKPLHNWRTSLRGWHKTEKKKKEKKKRNKKNAELQDARLKTEAARLKTEAARLETEKAKAEFYSDKRTANNQPEGVVLQQEDYHVKF